MDLSGHVRILNLEEIISCMYRHGAAHNTSEGNANPYNFIRQGRFKIPHVGQPSSCKEGCLMHSAESLGNLDLLVRWVVFLHALSFKEINR